MTHNFTGGITPEGRLPDTDTAINKIPGENAHEVIARAEKPLNEYTKADIAELASRLEIFDSRRDMYIGEMLDSVKTSERILVNCCENDLYSVSTAALCLERINELFGGCAILLYALNAQKAVLCCDSRSKKLAKTFEKHIGKRDDIAVATIADKYPINAQTVTAALYRAGKVLPHDADQGKYTVIGAEAVIALYSCLASGMPHRNKVFSLCIKGEMPIAVNAPVGTALIDIFKELGIASDISRPVYYGSLINCKQVELAKATIDRHTDQISIGYEQADIKPYKCIHCGRCASVCPLQNDVMSFVCSNGKKALKNTDMCIKCGCCAFICPSRIDILHMIAEYGAETEDQVDE